MVLAGGVFRTAEPGFHDRLEARIAETIPGTTLIRLVEPPVLGAVLIGLDRLAGRAVAPDVEARARAALHDWNATGGVVTPS